MKIEAVRIGNSDPAPLLTLITGPSEEALEVGKTKKEYAERYDERVHFWTDFLQKSKSKTNLYANMSPSKYSWIGGAVGWTGVGLNAVVWKNAAGVELYIDTGDAEENARIFDGLHAHAAEIESKFGGPLDWQALETKRACRIQKKIELGGYSTPDAWPAIHDAMIDIAIKMEAALKPHLRSLRN